MHYSQVRYSTHLKCLSEQTVRDREGFQEELDRLYTLPRPESTEHLEEEKGGEGKRGEKEGKEREKWKRRGGCSEHQLGRYEKCVDSATRENVVTSIG
jgi:hypothetical protein